MLSVFKRSVILQSYGVRHKGFIDAELTTSGVVQGYETFYGGFDIKELNIGDRTTINNKVVTILDKNKDDRLTTYYTDEYTLVQDMLSYTKAAKDLAERLQVRNGSRREIRC